MESNYNLPPLTEGDHESIFRLSRNPDPASRLTSNYYHLRKRQIYNDFVADLQADAANDYNERIKLQDCFKKRLQELDEEYDRDVCQAINLHLSMLGVIGWRPAPTL